MLFTTPTFALFLIVVYGLYWGLPRRFQNALLLWGSIVFYGSWDWRFLVLLFFISGIDYGISLAIAKAESEAQRKTLLLLSLISNLGILGFFKYFNFFSESVAALLHAIGVSPPPLVLHVILPLGISFYTFQGLSYTIDVYRRNILPVKNFTEYFCFIAFFPHSVAGPIQRATHLLTQFQKPREFDYEASVDGLRQMLWGLFKKMVVADNLAVFVQQVYDSPTHGSGWKLLWATWWFAIQIYCDFSGYTDIAIGCSRLFSLNLTRNFAYPYFALNIRDFWRRWHIALTAWFREYLYFPLGGNRFGARRAALNVFLVFLLSGLWHGANGTFLVWGALHGAYYYVYQKFLADRPALFAGNPRAQTAWRLLCGFVTFQCVCVGWVFFRAASVSDACKILLAIAKGLVRFQQPAVFPLALTLVVLAVEWFQRGFAHGLQIERLPRWARWTCYYLLVFSLFWWSRLGYTPFIYFQF